jgi:RimJ/RimL family protein N-acetyltransferase
LPRLVPLCEAHVGPVHALYSDPEVARRLLRIAVPFTLESAREFCAPLPEESGRHRFAALADADEFVGVGLVRDCVAELGFASIGYSVLRACWGRGHGTGIAAELVTWAQSRLGAREIRASVREGNRASERVLEKCGFRCFEAGVVETLGDGSHAAVSRWLLRVTPTGV